MSLKNIKLSVPTYDDVVPSTKAKVKLSPFRVADEKTLLIASNSEDNIVITNALKSVISNCVQGVKVEDLEPYDLEYFFMKLRAISVGEVSKIIVSCSYCEGENTVSVDLSTVAVEFNSDHADLVKIEDALAFKLKYPKAEELVGLKLDDPASVLEIMVRCIKEVYTEEEVITVGESDLDDLRNLVGSMTSAQFEQMKIFFETMPRLRKNIEFTCEICEHENKQVLEGLQSFF